jgi:hypothetical protein
MQTEDSYQIETYQADGNGKKFTSSNGVNFTCHAIESDDLGWRAIVPTNQNTLVLHDDVNSFCQKVDFRKWHDFVESPFSRSWNFDVLEFSSQYSKEEILAAIGEYFSLNLEKENSMCDIENEFQYELMEFEDNKRAEEIKRIFTDVENQRKNKLEIFRSFKIDTEKIPQNLDFSRVIKIDFTNKAIFN